MIKSRIHRNGVEEELTQQSLVRWRSKVYQYLMNELKAYQNAALKRAVVRPLDDEEGYCATIPGFNGLIVFGSTVKETKRELASVLEGWIAVSLKRGHGLPALQRQKSELATAH